MSDSIKAVAYYRMSSDKQEASIADQRTAVVKYAADNGYKIVREYLDEGISGSKSEQRHGFQKLIEDAQRAEFKAILCWDQDRFSRFPVMEANHYWYLLDRAGVHIATVAQGRLNFEDLGEWLKASVVQHGKAEFIKDLARNTARGLLRRKLAGFWIGGIPFGYVIQDGRLALGEPANVALVRRIFDLRAKGYGVTCIANKLNSDCIPSPHGKTWSPQGIRHILECKAYAGDATIGEGSTGRYSRIATEVSITRDSHPPIIDRETWEAVQRMPKMKRRANGRNGSEGAPLSGLLVCGRCGQPMYAKTNKGWEGYLCSTYTHQRGKCGHCAVRRDSMLKAVAAKLRKHVLMGSRDRLEAAIQRELDRRRTPAVDTKATARKLAALDRQIERAAGRILSVDDALVPDLEKQLLALKQRRDQLAATVDPQPAKRQPSAKAIATKLWELDRILREAPPTTVRHVLAQWIDQIKLDFEPAGKRFEFRGGTIRLKRENTARCF